MRASSISTGTILAYVTFASLSMLVESGCSSGSGGGGVDASEEPPIFSEHRDGGVDSGPTGTVSPEAGTTPPFLMYDGTLGSICASDVDCQPLGGPGINTCSVSTFRDAIFPTPVCIQTSCDLGTDGFVHFCDGPDNPGSPGVCVNTGQGGICLPTCLFPADGSAPFGCQPNDACVLYDFGTAAISADGGAANLMNDVVGIGYCTGGCTKNSDCPTGNACQTNEGICVHVVSNPTKALGAACTSADNGTATTAAACDCLVDPTTNDGYCSQFCLVGSTAAACPAGYLCDAFEPTTLVDQTDASVPGFAIQNTGLSGVCLAACDTTGVDAGSCPAGSMCTAARAAGTDCAP